ncbi:hypothetical protein [Chitinophaga tropicalis]|uniref:Uncharacterized protein n=1 Tax=Chitinophaga tropicalis TaxID=2683588 RepID=A0A7K1U2Y5_9BACT|nr:hypothetical protein [Chitinophaga tropicalis]MVT08734.1 hypothetical protein [Chitinophaga tropicalis]
MRGNIFSTAYMLSNFVAVLIVFICLIKPVLGRMCMSLIFIGASVVNAVISISHPEIYSTYADVAALQIYVDFINGFFSRHITTFILFIAAGQVLIGLALVWKGLPEKLGLAGAIIFLLAISPLGAGSAFPCSLLLALACIFLIREKKIIPWPLSILHPEKKTVKI